MSSNLSSTSTRPIPEVAINYRVIQNERTSGFTFKFMVQQRLEPGQNNARSAKKIPSDYAIATCNI